MWDDPARPPMEKTLVWSGEKVSILAGKTRLAGGQESRRPHKHGRARVTPRPAVLPAGQRLGNPQSHQRLATFLRLLTTVFSCQ